MYGLKISSWHAFAIAIRLRCGVPTTAVLIPGVIHYRQTAKLFAWIFVVALARTPLSSDLDYAADRFFDEHAGTAWCRRCMWCEPSTFMEEFVFVTCTDCVFYSYCAANKSKYGESFDLHAARDRSVEQRI